jgi:2-polyprenyl-3-methyl-5-hydroxy-6-metoxy-1,4-benzoquinol methylase
MVCISLFTSSNGPLPNCQVVWATQTIPEDPKPYILDIGTGNGVLLDCLAEAGYDPSRMLGIDYSPGSIELSIGVAKARGWDGIRFEVVDFVSSEPSRLDGMKEGEGWDLL